MTQQDKKTAWISAIVILILWLLGKFSGGSGQVTVVSSGIVAPDGSVIQQGPATTTYYPSGRCCS